MGIGPQAHMDDVEAATGQSRRLQLVDHTCRRLIEPTDILRSGQTVHLGLPYSGGNEWRGQHVVALRVPHGNAAYGLGLGGDERCQGLGQRDPAGPSRQRHVCDSPVRNRLGQGLCRVLAGQPGGVGQCRCDDDGWFRGRSRPHLDLSDRPAVSSVVSHERAPRARWPGPPGKRDQG